MKTFDIITEADARVLQRGETVMLARRGHITPLAQDTLRERRITVVQEGRAAAEDLGAGAARGHPDGGHRQRPHRHRAAAGAGRWLRGRGLAVADLGTDEHRAGRLSGRRGGGGASGRRAARPTRASSIDGAGIGSAIAANKMRGIRAVMATTETIARYSREHNGANVLTLGATLVTLDEARGIVDVWLTTPMREPRYIRRLAKIRDLEQAGR